MDHDIRLEEKKLTGNVFLRLHGSFAFPLGRISKVAGFPSMDHDILHGKKNLPAIPSCSITNPLHFLRAGLAKSQVFLLWTMISSMGKKLTGNVFLRLHGSFAFP